MVGHRCFDVAIGANNERATAEFDGCGIIVARVPVAAAIGLHQKRHDGGSCLSCVRRPTSSGVGFPETPCCHGCIACQSKLQSRLRCHPLILVHTTWNMFRTSVNFVGPNSNKQVGIVLSLGSLRMEVNSVFATEHQVSDVGVKI